MTTDTVGVGRLIGSSFMGSPVDGRAGEIRYSRMRLSRFLRGRLPSCAQVGAGKRIGPRYSGESIDQGRSCHSVMALVPTPAFRRRDSPPSGGDDTLQDHLGTPAVPSPDSASGMPTVSDMLDRDLSKWIRPLGSQYRKGRAAVRRWLSPAWDDRARSRCPSRPLHDLDVQAGRPFREGPRV